MVFVLLHPYKMSIISNHSNKIPFNKLLNFFSSLRLHYAYTMEQLEPDRKYKDTVGYERLVTAESITQYSRSVLCNTRPVVRIQLYVCDKDFKSRERVVLSRIQPIESVQWALQLS